MRAYVCVVRIKIVQFKCEYLYNNRRSKLIVLTLSKIVQFSEICHFCKILPTDIHYNTANRMSKYRHALPGRLLNFEVRYEEEISQTK